MNLLCALAAAAFVVAVPAAQSASRVGGFYMAAPEGWHPVTAEGMVANLQVQIDPAQMRQIVTNLSASTVLAVYQKYLPAQHRGLIPKVQVTLRRSPAKTFDGFRMAVARSAEQLRKVFPDHPATSRSVRRGPAWGEFHGNLFVGHEDRRHIAGARAHVRDTK